jgi:hypothetical protein
MLPEGFTADPIRNVILWDDEGTKKIIPAHFEVCGKCNGRGAVVNPSIDGNGLSQEELDDDPEFREAYFSGAYDISCPDCHGLRVVLMPDEGTEGAKAIQEAWKCEASYRAEIEAERRMGC